MKSTTIYKTVRGKETEDLDKRVNDAMTDGFQLYGAPYSSGDWWMCQALTREIEAPANAG